MADDLDQLLDSALDDFTKLDLAPATRSADGAAGPAPRGLGMGLPDPKAKRKGKQQQGTAPHKPSHATEALEQLTRQTREAVRGLETATGASAAAATPRDEAGIEGEAMIEDFVKQFEELAGTQDMESIVQTMMQQLLSKEILHEPMKEIGERYPRWLEDNKNTLKAEEYDRYYHQYKLILQLNELYENDSSNFSKIVDLMQKMQECGQPPNDIVQELAPDLDISSLGGLLSPELLQSTQSTGSCCIM